MLFTSVAAFSFAAAAAAVDALAIVTLPANDVTISVFTPFTVFTMVEQLVCGAEDVVDEELVVVADVGCDGFETVVALADVPSAGKVLGEFERLVVFVALPSVCSLNGSSLLSLSVSVLLLLVLLLLLLLLFVVLLLLLLPSISLGLFDTADVDSLSLALFVDVAVVVATAAAADVVVAAAVVVVVVVNATVAVAASDAVAIVVVAVVIVVEVVAAIDK